MALFYRKYKHYYFKIIVFLYICTFVNREAFGLFKNLKVASSFQVKILQFGVDAFARKIEVAIL